MTDSSSIAGVTEPGSVARRPMIVVDNAHVEYRVHASGKRVSARENFIDFRALRGGRDLMTVPALRGVTFTASEGESIGVVGHNGSGKSTLFRAMSGLIPTSEGTIYARDRPVLLGVNAALVPELSGEDNIKLGLLAMGYTAEEAASSVDEIADFAELNEFIHHPMRTYSSGMGARLRFAIASAKAHSILLVDEALAVGDRRFKLKSEERIRGLRDSAGLVMIVSHSVGSLRDTCERVLWIHKGELRADGPAGAVISDYLEWTKQPGRAAVGAASVSRPKRGRQVRSNAPSAVPAGSNDPTLAASAAGVGGVGVGGAAAAQQSGELSGVKELEELLADAAEGQGTTPTAGIAPTVGAATPTATGTPAGRVATPTGSLATPTGSDATPTGSVSTHPLGDRTVARRDRYRRTARQQRRARIIAVSITIAAILIAVGAGAAIALLTRAPVPIDRPATSTAATQDTPTGPPAVVSFDTSTPTVSCESAEGEAAVALDWQVNDAVEVAMAAGPAEVDAIDAPTEAALPTIALDHPTTFPCGAEAQTYTLTAEGADGSRVNSVVTVTRAPLPEPTPELVVPTQPVEPSQPIGPPVETAPPVELPPSEPSPLPSAPPVEPEPSPEPQETVDPQPSEQPSEEPSTQPEATTEPGESAEQSAPAEQPASSPEATTQP